MPETPDYTSSGQTPADKAAMLKAAEDPDSVFYRIVQSGYGIRCRTTGVYYNMLHDGTLGTQSALMLSKEDMAKDADGRWWFKGKDRDLTGVRVRMPERQIEFMEEEGEFYEMP
ncbi:hypothetical protein BJ508DRAFT_334843 [Ascobolus immersus RN42]|uniref:Uncharacterized protein n=1 Tax=Ascobolus immersus RN42 TaxID=1160509 RepID=A0A3N4HEN5_ASCIM|nr:hypothetical protein BJ508DRAFT_334843 [Ascobolus immersus RN42]